MFIGIEGCIGAGKSTLLHTCSQFLQCHPVCEEPEQNPFLEDFYHFPDKRVFAKHLLYTSLLLQERQLRQALPFSEWGDLVIADFHPLQNLVFAKVLFSARDQALLTDLYHTLSIPQPDIIIYLKADVHTILSHLRKKPDPHAYVSELDFTLLTQISSAYEAFFRAYTGRFLTIDTSHFDFHQGPHDMPAPLKSLQEVFDLLPYIKPQPLTKEEQLSRRRQQGRKGMAMQRNRSHDAAK
jgi:deoxyguanosine kinase